MLKFNNGPIIFKDLFIVWVAFFSQTFFLEKDRSCQYDNLQVLDGPLASSPLIGRYCGIIYPQKLTSTGTDLYLRFQTDESENEIGFNITYTVHDPIRKFDDDVSTNCSILRGLRTSHWTIVKFLCFLATCAPSDFTCSDGTCIDRTSVCDGIKNCASGNDEVVCGKWKEPSFLYEIICVIFRVSKVVEYIAIL